MADSPEEQTAVYNFARGLKTLKGLALYKYICQVPTNGTID